MPALSPSELLQNRILRDMSGAQRLGCAFEWTRLTYDVMLAGIRAQQPDLPDEVLAAEVRRRSISQSATASIPESSMPAGNATSSFGIPDQFAAVINALAGRCKTLSFGLIWIDQRTRRSIDAWEV